MTPEAGQKFWPYKTRTWAPQLGAIAAVLTVTAVGIVTARGGLLRPSALGPRDVLLLTLLQDKTGEKLNGAVLEGLELSLTQSPSLTVRSQSVYVAGLRQLSEKHGESNPSPRAVAHQVNAKAYLSGEISHPQDSGEHSPYLIRIDAVKTETNDRLLTLSERAVTRADLPAAIDRLARALRSQLGESRSSIAHSSEPLNRQATTNVDALTAYSNGDSAVQSGHLLDAISFYREAISRDEQFPQAHLQLAWLYSMQHAEVAAADAAQNAKAAARSGNPKFQLLIEFANEMIATGEYGRAAATIRRFNDQFPGNADGMVGLARVLRAQGHLVESLLAAQQAYGEDPFRSAAYTEAEFDMIGLGRFLDALRLEQQANALGVLPGRAGIPASYLAGRTDLLEKQTVGMEDTSAAHRSPTPSELGAYALSLDNSEKWDEGEQVWTRAAAMASTVPGLKSSSAYLLSQAALNRSLASRCSDAMELLGMSQPSSAGPVATFRAGMAFALCGHFDAAEQAIAALEQLHSNSLSVTRYGAVELRAAIAIGKKNPAKALELLDKVEPQGDPSLLPYLRSLAYTGIGEPQQIAENLRFIEDHRGAVYLTGISVYSQAKREYDQYSSPQQVALGR